MLPDHILVQRRTLFWTVAAGLWILPLWPELTYAESAFLGTSLIVFLPIIALLICPWESIRNGLKRPLTSVVLLWGITAILATIFARYPYGARADLVIVWQTVLVFFLLTCLDPTEGERRILLGGVVGGGVLLALWALWNQWQGPEEALKALHTNPMVDARVAGELEKALQANRAMARFGNPNHVAAYLTMGLWPAWYLLRHTGGLKKSALWGLAFLILAFGIFQTRSRAGVGTAAILTAAILVHELRPRWHRFSERQRQIVFFGSVLAAIPILTAILLNAHDLLGGRLTESGTIQARLQYYRGAAQLISKHWPWGVGLNGYAVNVTAVMLPGDAESKEAHNLILDAAVEIGPLGVILLLWLLLAAFKACRTRGVVGTVAGGMLLAYLFMNLVDFESELAEFAILFGFTLGLVNQPNQPRPWPEPVWTSSRIAGGIGLGLSAWVVWWVFVLCPYMSRLYEETATIRHYVGQDSVLDMQQAYAWEPGDALLMNALGKSLRFRNQSQAEANEGLRLMERAAQRQPDQAFLHGDLAMVYDQLGRNEDALAAIDRAIERFPVKTDYLRQRVTFLRNAGREAEAVAQMQQLLKIEQEAEERRL